MPTVETRSDFAPVTSSEAQPKSACCESRADELLSFAAIGGAVGGGVAGMILGAAMGTEYPMLWGTAGTMLGSALAAAGWYVFARLWAVFSGDGTKLARRSGAASH